MRELIALVIALLFAFGCASVARSKGRSRAIWGVLGFFFTIIALLIVALLPRRSVGYV